MNLLLSILLTIYVHSVTSLFCYWNTGCPYNFFSSKTPYNMLRGDIRDSLIKLTDCEPVSIWSLMRHGKTYPVAHYAKPMKETLFLKDYVISSYENGNSSLCAQDIENLRNWAPDRNLFDKDGQLSDEGYQELAGIGRRLLQAFPKLLKTLDKNDYIFRAVKEKWAKESIKAFVDGLGNKQLLIEPARDGYDNIIPYDNCAKYTGDIKQTNVTLLEAIKYQISSEYLASKDRLQRRLGIDYPLTNENIKAIWDFCRYTSSGIANKFSPWCALFTIEDLKVMEYVGDLIHYYRNGYGGAMNKLFGEIVMAELLKSFRDAKEGNGKKITGYVTEASMMDMAYTALGLYKDPNPLTAAQRKPDRKWRTSKFSIFSNNLIAILNKCGKKGDDDYNVVFYVNEEPLRICKDGVCTWKEFEDKLSPFLETNTNFCE